MSDDELEELAELTSRLRRCRWPWAPLEEAIGGGSWATMAAVLGIHQRQISRWRRYGLTDAQADRCATGAGLHPAIVWPGWDLLDDDLCTEGAA